MDDLVEGHGSGPGPCADLRLAVERECSDVPALRARASAAADTLSRARSALHESEARLDQAQMAADQTRIREAKAQAQRAYRRTYTAARDQAGRRQAATTWLLEVDRLNREARDARQAIERSRQLVVQLEERLQAATLAADTERIRAETAADACRTARERLAACEEQDGIGPTADEVVAATAGEEDEDAVPAGSDAEAADATRPPLVLERVLGGDREALAGLARNLADLSDQDVPRWMLLLQEFVDGVERSAAEGGYLGFADDDPFWSQFDATETRTIARALSGMGLRFDPRDGWAGGRAPTFNELSLAFAHAGLDIRGVRALPPGSDTARIFDGARVDGAALLADRAPQLSLDALLVLLGADGDRLAELWDAWGRVRPMLLATSERA